MTEELEREAPEGYRWLWLPDPEWTTDPEVIANKRCRMMEAGYTHCPNPAVAALRRRYYDRRKKESSGRWWCYCEEHLYGRRIANGRVRVRRLVKKDRDG